MNSSGNGVDGGYSCRVVLNQILAIVVRKEGCRGDPGDFWMYENGYLLFQVGSLCLSTSRITLYI